MPEQDEHYRRSGMAHTACPALTGIASPRAEITVRKMNGHRCPHCRSDDLVLARVIYEAGTARTHSRSEGSSTHTSGAGQFLGTSASEHLTESTTQTELAAQCTPPRPPNAHPFVMLAAIPLGLWALYAWIPMRWARDVIDVILVLSAGYLMVMAAIAAYRTLLRAADYSRRLEAYQRTCVCMRCGQHALLPEGWNQPDQR